MSLDVDRNLINQAVSPRGTQKANSFVNLVRLLLDVVRASCWSSRHCVCYVQFAGGDNDPSDDAAAVARRAQHAEELAAEHAKVRLSFPVCRF